MITVRCCVLSPAATATTFPSRSVSTTTSVSFMAQGPLRPVARLTAAVADDAGIALPAVPDDGALSDSDVVSPGTVVSAIPAPHAEVAPESVKSPLYLAYHQ